MSQRHKGNLERQTKSHCYYRQTNPNNKINNDFPILVRLRRNGSNRRCQLVKATINRKAYSWNGNRTPDNNPDRYYKVGMGEIIIGNKKLTYITPDRSPIDRIVVPNNRVNTHD